MNALAFVLGIPLGAALILTFVTSYKVASRLNILASLLTFAASLTLFMDRPDTSVFFLIDDLNIYLLALTSFVTFTTSLFSARYMAHEIQSGHLQTKFVPLYHALFQTFLLTMLLALATNNLGVMWFAVEGATLATVLLIGLYRTPAALEAAWKYFILCGVGIALAFFGTVLLYLAAQPVTGMGMPSLTWSVLWPHAAEFSPALLNIAFVFLLIGYGTKAGLVPMHAWLPDAHAEGPTPISALLSGLLLNVAIYAVLRFKMLLAANIQALAAGPLMILMGLGSLFLAGFMLYRRSDIKRLFAYSSIEHMGIIAFAFGIGGPLANFAGLLHMTMHSLTKAALFFISGAIYQTKGSLKISDIRGLTGSQPLIGWALVMGIAAIVGLPPSGLFMSEFLLISSTFAPHPVLTVLLIAGLLVAFAAMIMKMQDMAFGTPEPDHQKISAGSLIPVYVHVGLVLAAGIYLPAPLVEWFRNVAKLLG